MASPPFQMEDQTDEDFFDKLVDDDDDEIDYTRSVPSFVDGNDSDEVKAFANLNIGEVGPVVVVPSFVDGNDSDEVKAFANLNIGEVGTVVVDSAGDIGFGNDGEKGFGDGVASASVDAPENNLIANESIASTASNVVECIDETIRSDGATGNLTSAAGVKEVDWSSFNPDSHFQSGSGFGSYSDFFSDVGDNSGDPFATVADTGNFGAVLKSTDGVLETPVTELSSVQHQDGQFYETGNVQAVDGQDLNSNQYWENLYPGWRYDPNTGQWLQLDGWTADANTNVNALSATDIIPEQKSDIYYLQQTTQSVLGSIAEESTTGTVSNWNQVSPENAEYPAHMVFDPQYPGWYYDTIAQEWRLLESYTTVTNQPTSVDHYQQNQNANVSTGGNVLQNNYSSYDSSEQFGNYQSHGLSSQDQVVDRAASVNNYNHKNMTMWQPEPVPKSEAINFPVNQQFGNVYGSTGNEHSSTYHQTGFKPSGENAIYGQASQGFDNSNAVVKFQSFVPAENFLQQSSHSQMEPTQQMNVTPAYFESKKSASFLQPPLQSCTQFSHASSEGRSSAGRPPHALVTFGFGGKLVVTRVNSSMLTNSAYSSQESAGGVVNVFNLAEVVMDKIDASSIGLGACDYFQSLCQRSFPGPLAGGSVGSRELNKWIDDKIAIGDYSDKDYRKGEILKMLFSLLKIACQNYGKLRSPLGSDQALKDNNCPESAVVKLFASDRKNGAPVSEYGAHTCCLQNLPLEAHSQATALDVQKLLVSGRKKEALECAQQGQLWGPALVLAYELGGQFFADTVKQMALHQLVAGSPLRTLCLLIAGQPTDVFSSSTSHSDMSSAFNILQQPVQIGPNYVLDEWEENLAIITANRTKDDELVIIHLGDCLWKERGEVTAAHICYLVAEANFESYSDSARLCLIGADHWKFPRTYASPEAIQRTELYEYSKVLGNPQFILLPFQPYKLIYAYMLAEVGKLSDSLKYCQAIAKSLKTGRTPEVDTWKQLVSSFEERIRTHQQGGYNTNLAPTKLVGKLLNFFDNTAHRVVGGLPPPIPSSSHSKVQYNEPIHQQGGPRVSNSQSTMAMSTLMPSASMEPISEWTGEGNRTAIPNRSISEPDFGKTPRKVDSSKEEKTSVSGGSSRFGRFGSQLLQKTVGLVLRSRPDKQAKLGEKNRFYYDEKLKRWVEEGAEPPAEEVALPPPPTTAAFQNGVPGQNGINLPNEKLGTNGGPEVKTPLTSEQSPGIPPMPPSSNQFSARGRMGVRARYVDTFNKGGGTPANLFQSPSMPAAKSGGGSNPKFFVPPPAVSSEETRQTTGESIQEAVATNENPSTSYNDDSFSSPPSSRSSSVSMQRFPSMDNIVQKRMGAMANAQRAASWSGSLCDANNPSKMTERKPLGEVLGMPPSPFMPSNRPSMHVSTSKNSSTEDLHEVEL